MYFVYVGVLLVPSFKRSVLVFTLPKIYQITRPPRCTADLLFSLAPAGARSSPSGASKLALGPRRFPCQINPRLKIVANATGLRVPEGKEPKSSWWETSPLDHAENFVASFMPPGPDRQYHAAMLIRRFFPIWCLWLPLVSIIL